MAGKENEIRVEYGGMGTICQEFINDKGKAKKVPRVIYPLFIITGEGGGEHNEPGKKRATVISGCSFYKNCKNSDCVFSGVNKKEKVPHSEGDQKK
jgi:hypothetical protein